MALTEGKHTGEFLISEGNGYISRKQDVLAPTTVALKDGTVLGRLTAGSKLVPYANGASDGSQTAVAILYGNAPISTADRDVTTIARFAEVSGVELTGIDAAAVVDLEAKGVIVIGPLA